MSHSPALEVASGSGWIYGGGVVTGSLFGEGDANIGWLIVLCVLTPGDEAKAALTVSGGWL